MVQNGRIFEIRVFKSIIIKDLYYNEEIKIKSGMEEENKQIILNFFNSRNIKIDYICNTENNIYCVTNNFKNKIL